MLSCLRTIDACLPGCTCTTVPDTDEDSADGDPEDADDNNTDDDDIPISSAKGRKVNCSNNPYRYTSIEDLNRAMKIPLDTIYL